MDAVSTDLEQHLEAEDGVLDATRVLEHLRLPWALLPAGPRRWAPSDLHVEVEGDAITAVRMTYRTVGHRSIVIAGCAPHLDVDVVAERLATPLLFAHFRRTAESSMPPAAMIAALRGEPVWEEVRSDAGWRFGQAGVGSRPVRLVEREEEGGRVVVGGHGVAAEEMDTVVLSLVAVGEDAEQDAELAVRHRRALAQRWWDAPRAPWTPAQRSASSG